MGRAKLPDFDAERPPQLDGLPLLTEILEAPGVTATDARRHALAHLSFSLRSRSRLRFQAQAVIGDETIEFGWVLPRGSLLRGGTWIANEAWCVQVVAGDEDLIEVSAPGLAAAEARLALLKAAYHLGNRHVPLQVQETCLKLEYDYVLVDMLVAMGLKVQRRQGPFEPEWGAYAQHSH
jgi:urease accessory protein